MRGSRCCNILQPTYHRSIRRHGCVLQSQGSLLGNHRIGKRCIAVNLEVPCNNSCETHVFLGSCERPVYLIDVLHRKETYPKAVGVLQYLLPSQDMGPSCRFKLRVNLPLASKLSEITNM